MRRPSVVVYTREGCGLCARAERLVAREARRAHVQICDVDTDPRWVAAYGIRVPVITVDGEEIAAFELQRGVVRGAVRRARWLRTLGRRAASA